MPKAKISNDSGLKIEVDGTVDEINAIINYASGSMNSTNTQRRKTPKKHNVKARTVRDTPTSLIRGLINDNFFKPPKSLPQIRAKLTEMGHPYAVTSLSPAVLRLVRARELRRLKEKKNWVYTV
jgi:hypothetical protein